MNVDLGGAGPGCSAMRVRRLHAGELPLGERERVAAHLAGCERCKGTERELVAERAALRSAVPFEELAAGVAEKLAVPDAPRRDLPARQGQILRYAAPLAVAASVCLAVFVSRQRQEASVRSKGFAASIIAQDSRGLHELGAEPVAPDARLKVVLKGVSRREEVILLVEPADSPGSPVEAAPEISLLYAGPSREGPQPGAFVWTGKAPRATLLIVLGDQPLDAIALKARGRVAAPPDADLIELLLTR